MNGNWFETIKEQLESRNNIIQRVNWSQTGM